MTENRNVETTEPEGEETPIRTGGFGDRADGLGTPSARRTGDDAPGSRGSAAIAAGREVARNLLGRIREKLSPDGGGASGSPRNTVARQESEMEGPSSAAGTAGTTSRTPIDNVARMVQAGLAPCAPVGLLREWDDRNTRALVGDRDDSRRGLGVDEPVQSEGEVSFDPPSNAADDGDIEWSVEMVAHKLVRFLRRLIQT